jgi:3-oxoacyl-[acyl-carrier protein] reductase
MDLGIAGRKALLFGASRGMGRACAMQLAREGVDVTLVARTEGPLAEAAAAIRTACPGVRVTAVVGDLTRPEGRAAALEACPAPDILLNNADGPLPGDFRNWSRDDWMAAIDAMMLGPIEMMRLTVDGMMARRFGRILNIVSRSEDPAARTRSVQRRTFRAGWLHLGPRAADGAAQRDDQQPAAGPVCHRCAAAACREPGLG